MPKGWIKLTLLVQERTPIFINAATLMWVVQLGSGAEVGHTNGAKHIVVESVDQILKLAAEC